MKLLMEKIEKQWNKSKTSFQESDGFLEVYWVKEQLRTEQIPTGESIKKWELSQKSWKTSPSFRFYFCQ